MADFAEDIARREGFVADVETGHCEFDGGELVVVVEDREIVRQACGCGFAAKQARAERMERGKPRAVGRNSGAKEQIRNARPHFLGCLVGEGNGEDVFRGDAFRNKICHAERDGAGLAGASAGKNEERSIGCFSCEALFRIQLFKEREHCVRSGKFCRAFMVADERVRRKRRLWIDFCTTTEIRSVRGCAAEINVEKQEAMIFFERDELWNVKACVVEEIELALQIEIKQTFRGAVRGDNAVAEAGFFGGLRQFGPILVVTNLVARRERNWEAGAAT